FGKIGKYPKSGGGWTVTEYSYPTSSTNTGIRPAMRIDLNSVMASSGNFPDGYDFDNKDRYSFENIKGSSDLQHYKNAFGEVKGKKLYNSRKIKAYEATNHGNCFGMAATTAIFLVNKQDIKCFKNAIDPDDPDIIKDNIIDLYYSDLYYSDVDKSLTEYIKYAHLYQFSDTYQEIDEKNIDKFDKLWLATKSYVAGESDPIILDLCLNDDSEAHAVLVIGYNETDSQYIIYTNDSNTPDKMGTFVYDKSDNSWQYMGSYEGNYPFNSSTSYFSFGYAVDAVYNFWNSDNEYDESCIFSGGRILVNSDRPINYAGNSNSLLEIKGIASTDNNQNIVDNDYLYWLKDTDVLSVETDTETNISVSGDNSSITVLSNEQSYSEITLNNKTASVKSIGVMNKPVYSEFTTLTSDNSEINITISGTASADTVTATQTETGLVVTGISDGTVTLSKDDEVVETQTISNATSDIEITYDKTGESEDISLDYDHTHTDADHDGTCDSCGETLDAVKNCTHICHKTGFAGFIWKILRVFCKLFGINKYCECGVKHY
ncbi:MAG: hypothetical protein ACI4GY_03360, partial [Acutalibacteraceae bacterium]